MMMAAPAATAELTDAARDVLAERKRQVEQEGWTPEHDDEHEDYSLSRAAAAYAVAAGVGRADRTVLDDFGNGGITAAIRCVWPVSWDIRWFKPKSRRADLVKSGALILAEVERMDRLAAQAAQKGA